MITAPKEDALRRSNTRLELLSNVASELLASDSPQAIVESLAQKVMAFLDCHAFFNYLVDDGAGKLHLNACAGVSAETARDIEWLDLGAAVCGCVAVAGSRIVAEDIPTTRDPRTDLVASLGIKAYACHPLLSKGKVIGTLSFGTRTRTRFDADALALMKTVTDHIAIAMERLLAAEALRGAGGGGAVQPRQGRVPLGAQPRAAHASEPGAAGDERHGARPGTAAAAARTWR